MFGFCEAEGLPSSQRNRSVAYSWGYISCHFHQQRKPLHEHSVKDNVIGQDVMDTEFSILGAECFSI